MRVYLISNRVYLKYKYTGTTKTYRNRRVGVEGSITFSKTTFQAIKASVNKAKT